MVGGSQDNNQCQICLVANVTVALGFKLHSIFYLILMTVHSLFLEFEIVSLMDSKKITWNCNPILC